MWGGGRGRNTGEIAQEFLILRRRKLRHPVILPAGYGCPTRCGVSAAERAFGLWLWSLPLLLTDIDDISANDKTIKLKPKNVQKYDQNKPANPPLVRPCVLELETNLVSSRFKYSFSSARLSSYINMNSHDATNTTVKLMAESGRKFLY